jgi:hypothetical protein
LWNPIVVGNHTDDAKEAAMFIGQVEETGVIEPLEFPRVVPANEPVTPQTEPDEPVLEPAAAR